MLLRVVPPGLLFPLWGSDSVVTVFHSSVRVFGRVVVFLQLKVLFQDPAFPLETVGGALDWSGRYGSSSSGTHSLVSPKSWVVTKTLPNFSKTCTVSPNHRGIFRQVEKKPNQSALFHCLPHALLSLPRVILPSLRCFLSNAVLYGRRLKSDARFSSTPSIIGLRHEVRSDGSTTSESQG